MIATADNYENLMREALRLPEAERARLAILLQESLDDGDQIHSEDDEVSDEWMTKVRHRSTEIRNGTAIMVSHDDVMAEARSVLANKRQQRAAKP